MTCQFTLELPQFFPSSFFPKKRDKGSVTARVLSPLLSGGALPASCNAVTLFLAGRGRCLVREGHLATRTRVGGRVVFVLPLRVRVRLGVRTGAWGHAAIAISFWPPLGPVCVPACPCSAHRAAGPCAEKGQEACRAFRWCAWTVGQGTGEFERRSRGSRPFCSEHVAVSGWHPCRKHGLS